MAITVKETHLETDLLIIGGGIAGCCLAAKAADKGLKVTLLEKANTERSGSAGVGIDHYGGPMPRGMTVGEFKKLLEANPFGFYGSAPFTDPSRLYRLIANGEWAVEELEKLGCQMRWDDGELRMLPREMGWGVPFLRVHWKNVKPDLHKAIIKRKVNVLERTMAVDCLTEDGKVIGATAFNVRTGEFYVIKAKAVTVCTGLFARLYEPETPQPWKFKMRFHWCPATISGDGIAIAYRAGAELGNMEQGGRGYRYRDDLTLSYGNKNNEGVEGRYTTWDGEEFLDDSAINLERLDREGKWPIYMAMDQIPDDFQKRIEVAFADERLISMKIAEDRGFDPRNHWYEIMDSRPNQLFIPGVVTNWKFESSVEGLYAIGDSMSGNHDAATAATSGLLLGEDLGNGELAKKAFGQIDAEQVAQAKERIEHLLNVKEGTEPMELECAVRNCCIKYIGAFRSEGKLLEGQRRLGTLERKFLNDLECYDNPHRVMRALEVRNIMQLANVHLEAALNRRETAGGGGVPVVGHIRSDYPNEDPALRGKQTRQRLENGEKLFYYVDKDPIIWPDDHKEEL